MVDDLLLNRAASIERAILRVRELHAGTDEAFTRPALVDAITLALLRACEHSIGAAMHLVRINRLGIPQETGEAFDLIERAGFIEPALADKMRTLVAFRQAAVADQLGQTAEVRRMVDDCLGDVQTFAAVMIRRALGDTASERR